MMYVLLHLQVHVLSVSVFGARSLSVAGRAIEMMATSVLSKDETRTMPFAGNYSIVGQPSAVLLSLILTVLPSL